MFFLFPIEKGLASLLQFDKFDLPYDPNPTETLKILAFSYKDMINNKETCMLRSKCEL